MKCFRLTLLTLSIVALATGSAFASKQDEMDQQAIKPWSLTDLPQLQALADVFETEPLNDTCPGEPYVMGDVYHASITSGDEDWICFAGNVNDVLTIGTDTDNTGDDVDTVIELYAQDCVTLLISDDDGGPGLYSLISGYALPATGNYYLKIRGFSSSSTGDYQAVGALVPATGPGFCPLGTYKAIKRNSNQEITDTAGTICAPDIEFWDLPGLVVTDVVIDLNIEHTWVGDLQITLCHTSDMGVVTCVDLVQRPGVPQTTFGCAGDLISDPEDKYYFSSRPDLEPLGEFDCPAVIDPACYATAIEAVPGLEVFNGMDFGDGTWSLCITDNAAGDDGFLHNWSVHLLADAPVSVEPSSWSSVKAMYR